MKNLSNFFTPFQNKSTQRVERNSLIQDVKSEKFKVVDDTHQGAWLKKPKFDPQSTPCFTKQCGGGRRTACLMSCMVFISFVSVAPQIHAQELMDYEPSISTTLINQAPIPLSPEPGLIMLDSTQNYEYSAPVAPPPKPKPRISPLYLAVSQNSLDAVQSACQEECSINEVFYQGNTILHVAAQLGNLPIYQYALSEGASYTTNNLKETPLHLAAMSGNVELVDYILSNTKNPQKAIEALTKDNQTPLMYSFKNYLAKDITALYLLARKADCNVKDKNNQTAMTWAMVQKNYASFDKFLSYGCDFFIKDKDNLTPAHMAVKQSLTIDDNIKYTKFLNSGLTVKD